MTMVIVTVLLLSIVEHVYGRQYIGRYRGYGAFSGFGGYGRGTGGRFGGGSRGSLTGRLGGVSNGKGSGFAGGITLGGPGFGVGSSRDRRSSGVDMGGGGEGLSMMGRVVHLVLVVDRSEDQSLMVNLVVVDQTVGLADLAVSGGGSSGGSGAGSRDGAVVGSASGGIGFKGGNGRGKPSYFNVNACV
ncbi:uncharacterized protein [Mytilus edulis]|uniref:uncharacterized protein n=1 Tax=Mytilus edulis TaxID=6550 RepID=UPI0039F0F205